MATIATSIEIYDRVSKPITRMISALGDMCDAYESVERSMDGGFDTASIERARRKIEETALEVVQLGADIENNENKQNQFNQSVSRGSSAMDGLLGKVAGLVAGYASLQGVGKLVNMSDEFVQSRSRLDMMNDGLQTTDELVDMVYQSAQNARGSFSDMASVVARLGNNAKDAFSSSAEIVDFANLVQKQFVIAGAGASEASNAMLQLSQALASGTLRGDELNSIFEQAPNLIQTVADYLNVPIGKIREMASEGQITGDIVKNAMFAAADEINAKFNSMPKTWGQIWTMMQNGAMNALQPVLMKINELLNSERFMNFAAGVVNAFGTVAVILLDILDLAGAIVQYFTENWSQIAPIIMGIVTALGLYYLAMGLVNVINGISAFMEGVKAAALMMSTGATFAATAAQHGFNAALFACPLTWIILLVILFIVELYRLCDTFAKASNSANSAFGVIAGGIWWIGNLFKNVGLWIANVCLGIANVWNALNDNIRTAFHNAICSVKSWWYDLMSTAIGVIESICAALNKLPFVDFDYSGITAAADAYAAKSAEAAGNKEEYTSIGDAWREGYNTHDVFEDGWGKEAFARGAKVGDGVTEDFSSMIDNVMGAFNGDATDIGNFDFGDFDSYDPYSGGGSYDAGNIPSNIAETAGNTGSMADSMEITSEDLKYLRDIAEKEAVNRFTTAEIKVEMVNNNSIGSEMDLDGIVDYLANGVNEAMERAAEGVYA